MPLLLLMTLLLLSSEASAQAPPSRITAPTFVDNLWMAELGAPAAPVIADRNAIWLRYDGYDAVETVSPLWSFGALFHHVQSGGNGHRGALWGLLEVTGGARDATTFSTAVQAMTFGSAPGGTYVGSNPYVRVHGDGVGAFALGEEINTDVQVRSAGKVGLQIVDVASSVGQVDGVNAALRIVSQPGASNFADGLLFDSDPQQGVMRTGALMRAVGTYGRGIDLGGASFLGAGITLPVGSFYASMDEQGVPRGLLSLWGGQIRLGGGYYGPMPVSIPATGTPPPPGPHMDGVITMDPNRGLIFYAGGRRYRLAGTEF